MENTIRKEKVEEMDNVVDLSKFKRLGTDSSGKTPGNWLADIEPGTVILVGKTGEILATEYTVAKHRFPCTLLISDLNEPKMNLWVKTREFSDVATLLLKGDVKKDVSE